MKEILLTGSNGFLGSHILSKLLNSNQFDFINNITFEFNPDGVPDCLEGFDYQAYYNPFQGDVDGDGHIDIIVGSSTADRKVITSKMMPSHTLWRWESRARAAGRSSSRWPLIGRWEPI